MHRDKVLARKLIFAVCFFVLPISVNASKSNVNRPLKWCGDVTQVAIPLVAFTTTLCLKDYKGTIQFLEAFACTEATVYALKYIVNERRPGGNGKLSFPSGHTAAAFCGAAFINRRYGLKYAIPAYAGAVVVGVARIQSKAHWVHDVLAGAAIGILYSFLFAKPYFTKTVIVPTVTKDSVALHCNHKF